jgi:biopolymer transport protein ExbD
MRPTQPINAGSMADIAFLLLIFFLVTTTIESDSGLMRKLPPNEDSSGEIKRRNVLNILINNDDQLMVNLKPMEMDELREFAAVFIQNHDDQPPFPEIETKDLPLLGEINVSRQVISLQCATHTSYGSYVGVQDALASAYRSARNDFSEQHFSTSFDDLLEAKAIERIKVVQSAIPMRISEAEPFK